MTTITYDEKDTSEVSVKNFLERIRDYNPVHWEHNIMPGMYALELLQRTITQPISRVNILFKGMVKFPTTLDLKLEEFGTRTHFEFKRNSQIVYEGDLHYNGGSTWNAHLLKKVHLIGGELQRTFEEEELFPEETVGIYTYQSMDFKREVEELNKPYFPNKEKLDKRTYNILTFCDDQNGELSAEGHAVVKGISKRLFERMIQKAV